MATLKFPSEAWTQAFKDAVNANADYRRAGAEWTHGSVGMVVSSDPKLGLERDLAMILDVDRGQCRSTSYTDRSEAESKAPFVIVAPYARWKEVIEGKLDPIKAMMQGQLKLVKGHLPTMIRYVEASRQLVASAARVPTEFIA